MYVAIIRYGFIYFMFRTTELNICIVCTNSVQYGVLNFCTLHMNGQYLLLIYYWDKVGIFFRSSGGAPAGRLLGIEGGYILSV